MLNVELLMINEKVSKEKKMKKNSIILDKTFDFALSIIDLYKRMLEQ